MVLRDVSCSRFCRNWTSSGDSLSSFFMHSYTISHSSHISVSSRLFLALTVTINCLVKMEFKFVLLIVVAARCCASSHLSLANESSEIDSGRFFRISMTISTSWSDEYSDKSSGTFNKLAIGLGSELTDFIDNYYDSHEVNLTEFKLVGVQRSKNSGEEIYATFIVTSKRELRGDDLSSVIINRISESGGFYEHKATVDDFVFETISKEDAVEHEANDFLSVEDLSDESSKHDESSVGSKLSCGAFLLLLMSTCSL